MGRDFFTLHTIRIWTQPPGKRSWENDTAVAQAFLGALPSYAECVSTAPPYTVHFSPRVWTTVTTGNPRLGRFYASSNLMAFVVSSTVPVPTPSHHQLAMVALLPWVTTARGPGNPRLYTCSRGLADLKWRFMV